VFFREVKAAELAAEDRLRELTTQAWQANRIFFETKAKKRMPKLKQLLNEIGTRREAKQSNGQLRAALHTLSGQYGIPLRSSRG
jgi:hypothetical protein